MPSFRFRYSASCNFLSPLYCFVSQALHSYRPPVSSSAVSLGFRFRFRLLGLSVLNFSVRFRPRIYYHCRNDLSTSILYCFRLLSCTLLYFLFLSAKFYFTNVPDGTQNGIRNFHKRPSTALYIFPALPQRSIPIPPLPGQNAPRSANRILREARRFLKGKKRERL